MDKIVVIGKVRESSRDSVEMEYEAASGRRPVRLPRSVIDRIEILGDDRMAVLVNITETESGRMLGEFMGSGPHAPLHIETQDLMIVEALENGEEIGEINMEEEIRTNDEKPQWNTAGPSISVGGQVVAQVSEAGPFDAAFASGGRAKHEIPNWDFTPVRKPALVHMGDNASSNQLLDTVARVNTEDGEAEVFHIFNPEYASEKRPAGAYLGTFKKNYYPMPYREGFGGILDMAAQNGWPAKVVAYKEGKRADLYMDVTSSVNWDNYDFSTGRNHGLKRVGDYRIGIVVRNSLDGSSSFKVQAVAMRLACSNGMVVGSSSTLLTLKHTVQTLKGYDFSKLAGKIDAVMREAAIQIINVENMADIQITDDMFDRFLTICESKGLIAKPQVKRDEQGKVVDVNGGHMWRVAMQGWTRPAEPWVAVEEEDAGTLYQVYNILTGAITHKPVWTNAQGKELKGTVLDPNTVNERLKTVHDLTTKFAAGKLNLDNVTPFSELIV